MNYLTIEMASKLDIKLVVNEIMNFRKENEGKWYQVTIVTTIGVIRMKCFNTWIQVCDQPFFSTAHDLKIRKFKQMLIDGLEDFFKQEF